jgi:hypothetical protein
MGDVFCDICGQRWDATDPGVRPYWSEYVWQCADESQCFTRKAMDDLIEEEITRVTEREVPGDAADQG